MPASLVVLVVVLVGGVALWALARPQSHDPAAQQELDALRDSSAAREAKATSPAGAGKPVLCGALRKTALGDVRDGSIHELSGLVQSRRDASLLWGIQDSGNAPELIALRPDGRVVGRWTVAGATNFDWEDLATGPSSASAAGRAGADSGSGAGSGAGAGSSSDGAGVPWLYASDIGDNAKQRDDVVIYRVPEPTSPSGGGTTAPAQALHLRYPDGAHDAESFLVDPRRGTLIVITKGYPGGTYFVSRPSPWAGTLRLRRIGDAAIDYATAADVSADGRTVGLRGYFSAAFWLRHGSEPLTATLRRPACVSPTGMDDGQGESLALARDGRRAWLVAEGEHPPIHELTPR